MTFQWENSSQSLDGSLMTFLMILVFSQLYNNLFLKSLYFFMSKNVLKYCFLLFLILMSFFVFFFSSDRCWSVRWNSQILEPFKSGAEALLLRRIWWMRNVLGGGVSEPQLKLPWDRLWKASSAANSVKEMGFLLGLPTGTCWGALTIFWCNNIIVWVG